MGTQLQLLHDTDANLAAYTGPVGEITVSTTDGRPRSSNGVAGGKPLAFASELLPGSWTTPTLGGSPAWIAYGGGFQGPRYRKDSAGMVTIEGLIQAASGSTTLTIFTLPVGFRPPADLMFNCYCGGGAYRCDVKSTGDVVLNAANLVFTSFAGIQFYTN